MNIWHRRWVAIGFCILVSGSAGAAVSQVPLTGTMGSVMPNLMFTLDDSSSMTYECVPDPICIGWDNRQLTVTPWTEIVTATPAMPVTYNSDVLIARRLRSSAYNALYYDPQVRYLPWLKADGSRYPQYPASDAPNDPSIPSVRMNLVKLQTINSRWGKDDPREVQALADETVWVAQYYQLGAGKTGGSKEDYTQVIISPATTTYPKGVKRTDCAGSSCTYEEEAQNFSNWFTYARNRLKVAKGGTAEAFAYVPSGFRVGYGTINSPARDIDGVPTQTILVGVRPFSGSGREAFFNQLFGALPMTGTPLRRALDDVGKYFSRTDSRSPWADNMETGQPLNLQQTCRRSYHVLMTDGLWSANSPAITADAQADVDSLDGPRIDPFDTTKASFKYRPAPPYRGTGGSTLADVAMYYWNRDLQPDLKNDVPASDSDPAFWQHLVNYTIGLGITGNLRNPEDLPELVAGTKSWTLPAGFSDVGKADDLWHAAINSRGGSALANSVTEYTNALKSMVQTMISSGGREAGIAVSGRSYSAENSVKYIPSYKPSDWTGEIQAQKLSDGSVLWSASKLLPDAASRNIYTLGPDSSGVPFTTSAMNTTTQGLLGSPEPAKLINYLRGDQTEESVSYRKRTSLLGDIVNSKPIFVKDLIDGQYDFLSPTTAGQSTYVDYVRTKKYRTPQLFIGANDGMLHAFNANTGVESFAYIPRSVLGQLKNLAKPAYDHQYFVDGPSTEIDIYDTTDSKWRNLVIGGTGAGAKSLFAINVPVPAIPTTGEPTALNAAQSAPGSADILWEINNDNSSYSDLGHVLQAPEAGVMRDGTWVVITGNGYDSASGDAKLYVINARTGARVAVLNAGAPRSSGAPPNGLGGVKVVRDGDMRIVAAYAGDLAGRLWKFDFSSATPTEWNVAFSGSPLFSATNSAGQAESFTAAPTVVSHPLGGVMVLAGTGKLIESDDASSTSEKSLYGLWDKASQGGSVSIGDLVAQTITSLTINGKTGNYFAISNNSVDYGTGATARKRGWKIRLTIASGQRLIYAPQIYSDRVIFDTMVPGGVATGCAATQPQGYTFVIDPFTGAPRQDGPTFDTDGDGKFTAADDVTSGATWVSSIGQREIVGNPGASQIRLEGSAPPDGGAQTPGTCDPKKGCTPTPPPSKLVKRQWRQIVTPPSY